MVGRFGGRGYRRKSSIAAQRVGTALGVQEISGAAGAGQRPVILFAPLVRAHYKNSDRLAGEAILRALEKIVVPGKRDFVFVVLRGGAAKIHVSDFAAVAGMTADRHQQVLSLAGRLASGPRPQAHVIADGTALKNVIPGGDAQNRDGDIRVVIFNRPAFPIIVVARMREPVEEIGSERAGQVGSAKLGKIEQGITGQGKCGDSLGGIGFGRHLAVSVFWARPEVHDSLNHCSNAPPW